MDREARVRDPPKAVKHGLGGLTLVGEDAAESVDGTGATFQV